MDGFKYSIDSLNVCTHPEVIQNSPYVFKRIQIPQDSGLQKKAEASAILFLIQGCLHISVEKKEQKIMHPQEIFFWVEGISYHLQAESTSEVFIFSIPDMAVLYYQYIGTVFPCQNNLSRRYINILPLNNLMGGFLDLIIFYKDAQILDQTLLKLKAQELFQFIRHSFTGEELGEFFSPVLNRQNYFVVKVHDNYTRVKTVRELAGICNMSLSSFQRTFRKIFKQSPHQWVIKKKTDQLLNEIYHSKKPLKEIAETYAFSTFSQLVDFCKKHMGMSPGEIRKNKNRFVL